MVGGFWSRLLGAGAVVAVCALVVAPPAPAIVARMANGKLYSYLPTRQRAEARALAMPFDAFFENVEYNGGPVMPQAVVHVLYWDPEGVAAADCSSSSNELR